MVILLLLLLHRQSVQRSAFSNPFLLPSSATRDACKSQHFLLQLGFKGNKAKEDGGRETPRKKILSVHERVNHAQDSFLLPKLLRPTGVRPRRLRRVGGLDDKKNTRESTRGRTGDWAPLGLGRAQNVWTATSKWAHSRRERKEAKAKTDTMLHQQHCL